MAISTNSVIHYTGKLENLKGIISSQVFKIKYCLESITVFSDLETNIAFPMVSFCDIPLSEVKNHLDSYGSYGIGLTKSWAKKSGLNPVLYLEKESFLTKHFGNQYVRVLKNSETEKENKELLYEHFAILSYCKNYEGKLIHGKINTDSYRFYDEREWRYVIPSENLNGARQFIAGSNYLKDKEKCNAELENCHLAFTFEDISYIIVDDENDIPEILNIINSTFEDICTSRQLKILSTRILSKNQIYNDF
jgi:hypothetical protein